MNPVEFAIRARLDEIEHDFTGKADLADALRAVLDLHVQTADEDTAPFQSCRACAHDWPCPTLEAVAEKLGAQG